MKEKILQKIREILNNKALIGYCQHLGKAGLFSVIILLIVVVLTDVTYRPKVTNKRGYEVAIVEAKPAEKTADGKVVAGAEKAPEKVVTIAELLKTADAAKGEKIFKKCAACHGIEKGAPNKIGPNLYGIVGRNKAAVAGFQYSSGMKAKGGKWSVEDINTFIAKPKDFVAGTKMTFAGLKNDKDRANVISYLVAKGK